MLPCQQDKRRHGQSQPQGWLFPLFGTVPLVSAISDRSPSTQMLVLG